MQQASQPVNQQQLSIDPEQKLRRMTILVGMVGSDGILLATDQRTTRTASNETEFDDHADIRKIIVFEKHKVASSRVGDPVSMMVTNRIKSALDSQTFDFSAVWPHLIYIAEAVVREENAKRDFDPSMNRTLLIVFYGEQSPEFPQLWRLRISPPYPAAELVTGITINGAIGNRARFFDYYFEDNTSVHTLQFLAAHIVLMANRFDPLMIRGLDIALFDKTGVRLLDEHQKSALRKRSSALDALIRAQLSGLSL
jgi:hypothetical protein